MIPNPIYELDTTIEGTTIRHLFVSMGDRKIVKVIEFKFSQKLGQFDLFNLGFGNLDLLLGMVDDNLSNNGDSRTVFNTVLSTIPAFFNISPKRALQIFGSDGRNEFRGVCFSKCGKRCPELMQCKKFNQRIAIYSKFIDSHFQFLSQTYSFCGINWEDEVVEYEPSDKNKKRDLKGILIFKE